MPVQLTIKARGAELVRQGLQDLGAEVPKIGRQTIYDALSRALKILRQPAKKPHYPLQWDSDFQKVSFFRSGGFGKGIPYKRTGRYEKGWQLVKSSEIGYRLENPSPVAKYIGGSYEAKKQSRIHESRWPLFAEVAENAIQGLPEQIEEHITYYARQKGF